MINKNLDKLQPEFKKKVEVFLKKRPDIEIVETYRTAERQNQCYKNGASQLDGYNKKSQHQLGLAVDIKFVGADPYPRSQKVWRKLADDGKLCGLDCGLDLWGWDEGHFQNNSTKINEYSYGEEGEKAVDFCIENKIFRDYLDLQRILSPNEIEQILSNLNKVTNLNTGLTKERWAILIKRISEE